MAAIIVALLLLVPLHSASHTNLAIVENDILYVGGSGPGNYTSIQAALDDAGDGATIYVYPGTYTESIVLGKEVRLIGRGNGRTPVIQAVENQSALLIVADGCSVKGFTVKSQDVRSDDNPSACEIRSDSNIIENNTFVYGREAVFLNHSSHNIVTQNTIRGGWWRGMHSRYGTHNVISYNEAKHNSGDGFCLVETNSTIMHNTATENSDGISMTDCHSCIISFNSVYENDQYGMSIDSSANLSFTNNSIHSHPYAGLQLMDCHDCTATGNEIHDNGAGIWISSGYVTSMEHNIEVAWNSIRRNEFGVLSETSINNVFRENNFIDNDKQAWFMERMILGFPPTPTNPCNNTWSRNYWSDWSSSEPKPISGKLEIYGFIFSYSIPWRMYDRNPAMEPYGNGTGLQSRRHRYRDGRGFTDYPVGRHPAATHGSHRPAVARMPPASGTYDVTVQAKDEHSPVCAAVIRLLRRGARRMCVSLSRCTA